jgi:hypothetical protein
LPDVRNIRRTSNRIGRAGQAAPVGDVIRKKLKLPAALDRVQAGLPGVVKKRTNLIIRVLRGDASGKWRLYHCLYR